MRKNKAIARLGKELKAVQDEFPPGVLDMFVCDSNLHELFFAIAGPEKTSFEGGVYVLKIALPKDYPYSPPDFLMYTPNGRFGPGAKICTSFSGFHPETWSPAYTITTLVVSFISFFSEENANAAGVVHDTPATRKKLAKESVEWGRKSQYSKKLRVFSVLKNGKQTEASLKEATNKIHGDMSDVENRAVSNGNDSQTTTAAPSVPAAGPSACIQTVLTEGLRETSAHGSPLNTVGGSAAKHKSPQAVRQHVQNNSSIDLTSNGAPALKKKRTAAESIDLTADGAPGVPASTVKVTKSISAVVDLT